MKSFDNAMQGLITIALVGFGVLCGLAVAVLINGMDIGGVAPLFANALGAAIGATITLWATERRATKAAADAEAAAKKVHRSRVLAAVGQITLVSIHLDYVRREIEKKSITGLTISSLMHLETKTRGAADIFLDLLLHYNLVSLYVQMAYELSHAERIAGELRKLDNQDIADALLGAHGAAISKEMGRIAEACRAAGNALKERFDRDG